MSNNISIIIKTTDNRLVVITRDDSANASFVIPFTVDMANLKDGHLIDVFTIFRKYKMGAVECNSYTENIMLETCEPFAKSLLKLAEDDVYGSYIIAPSQEQADLYANYNSDNVIRFDLNTGEFDIDCVLVNNEDSHNTVPKTLTGIFKLEKEYREDIVHINFKQNDIKEIQI